MLPQRLHAPGQALGRRKSCIHPWNTPGTDTWAQDNPGIYLLVAFHASSIARLSLQGKTRLQPASSSGSVLILLVTEAQIPALDRAFAKAAQSIVPLRETDKTPVRGISDVDFIINWHQINMSMSYTHSAVGIHTMSVRRSE